MPSSGSASGAIFIPPPMYGPLATMTSCIRARRVSPSTETETSLFPQRAKTANVAQMYETLPPNALEVSLARCAIAPLMPALPTFANKDSPSPPAQSR